MRVTTKAVQWQGGREAAARAARAAALPQRTALAAKYLRAARVALSLPLYRFQPSKEAYASWLKSEMEAAGCLFVKIGQWVASRTDLFPPDVTGVFSALQSDVTPMPLEEVAAVLREEGLAFDSFEPSPVSSGSVAQVHRGRLGDREVAIKIQRPRLLAELAEDLALVRLLMLPLALQSPKSLEDALKSLDGLGVTIAKETDFPLEAVNMRAFARFFEGSDWVRVPEVYAVTPRAIVMEYVPSAPVGSSRAGVQCDRLIELFLSQVLELGRVHTDMHAGNLGLDTEGRVVLYDFGSVMPVSDGMRECAKRLFVSYLNRNPCVMLDYLTEFGVLRSREPLLAEQRVALEAFVGNVLEYVEQADIRQFQEGLKAIPIPSSLPAVEFQPEVFMIFRSFTLLEGLCKELDPEFVILEAMTPYALGLLSDPDMYRFKMEDDLRNVWEQHGK